MEKRYINNQPLVSIIVITYNSSKYVLETLESAKAQTYQNIELIITDDASQDDTVEICKDWLDKNKDRFVRVELITVGKNTGTSANCNRGLHKARGEWVKYIAGDDVLLNNCIYLNLEYSRSDTEIFVIHSIADRYFEIFEEKNKIGNSVNSIACNNFFSAYQQFILLQFGSFISAPTFFVNKNVLDLVSGFDEVFAVEDWPLWLKLTKKNYKIFFLNIVTVKYRVHSNSVSNKMDNFLFSKFYLKEKEIYEKLVLPYCSSIDRFFISYKYSLKYCFDKFNLNKDFFLLKLAYRLLLIPIGIRFKYIVNTFYKQSA